MNRAHRIGQKHAVSVTTYYMRDTVEERLLAYRRLSGEEVAVAAAGHAAMGEDAAQQVEASLGGQADTIGAIGGVGAAAGAVLGVGMSGGDAQGLTLAKLRALFGLMEV